MRVPVSVRHEVARGEAVDRDVDIAEDRDDEGVLDADAVGDLALRNGRRAPPTMACTIRLEPLLVSAPRLAGPA